MRSLQTKLPELRKYYNDQQLADDFRSHMDDYVKEGYDRGELQAFVSEARPGMVSSFGRGLKGQGERVVAGGAQGYLGLNELLGRIGGDTERVKSSVQAQGELAKQESAREARVDVSRQEHPFAVGLGEALPAALPSGRATAAGRIGSAAASYGGLGLLQYGTPQQRIQQGGLNALSATVGAGAGEIAAKLAKPAPTMTRSQSDAMKGIQAQAKAAGTTFKPRLSDVAQNKTLQQIEDAMAEIPGSGDVMEAGKQAQRATFNSIAAKSIGQTADDLHEGVFAQANQLVDDAYTALRGVKSLQIGNTLVKPANEVISSETLKINPDRMLVNYAKAIRDIAGKNITGERADILRQEIAKNARAATGGDVTRWYKLLNAFDDGVRDAAGSSGLSDVTKNLDNARRVLGNLKLLEKPAVVKGGNVMPQSLRSQVINAGNQSPELNAIANYAGAFPPLSPNSRTFGRGMLAWGANNPITSLAAVPALNVAARGMQSNLLREYLMRGLLFQPQASAALATAARPTAASLGTYMGNAALGPIFEGR